MTHGRNGKNPGIAANRQPLASRTAQLKTRAVAPSVYRPNPTPKVCQLKSAAARPPAVYRPQPVPKVLQRKVTNPPQTKVIQRNINSTHFEKTHDADPLYMINPVARDTLYSKRSAPPPRPQGLYTKKLETDDSDGSQVFAWKPNVRFLSRAELGFHPRTGMYPVDGGERRLDLPGLFRQIEQPHDPGALENPTFGILGKNDCTSFAETLYSSIARESYREERDDEVSIYQEKEDDYPSISIGDMMVHKFQRGQCKWHGATVVAEHGNRQVTLEADVSRDSTVPYFHIRQGVASFVAYNNEDSDEPSTKVSVTKYVSGKPPDGDLRRYQTAKTNDPTALVISATTSQYRPMSSAEHNVFLPLGHLLLNARWNTQGEGWFSKKTPDGVVKMRAAYTQRKYWDVFKIAEAKNRTDDSNRSSLVRDLYNYLAEVWRQIKAATKQQLPGVLRQLMADVGSWDRELTRHYRV